MFHILCFSVLHSKVLCSNNFKEIAILFRHPSMTYMMTYIHIHIMTYIMTAFSKSFTNNKKKNINLKLLFKFSNKVSEEIYKIYCQL